VCKLHENSMNSGNYLECPAIPTKFEGKLNDKNRFNLTVFLVLFFHRTNPTAARSLPGGIELKSWKNVHTDRLSMWRREDAKSSMPDGVICIRSKIACL